jgi:Flp pilus assembly CpaE family ATPase
MSRQGVAWLESLDRIATLHPRTIVTGRKCPEASDDRSTAILDESRRYLLAFDRILASCRNAQEVMDIMIQEIPHLGSPGFLRLSAEAAFNG